MAATPLHLIKLGCARNDVDAEELAGRFAQAGYDLVDDASAAEVIVVNTCGFVTAAKQESIDLILSAAALKGQGRLKAVVAAGCLAERYGAELAASLPEADAVIGFDGYDQIAASVRTVLAGGRLAAPVARDRRRRRPHSMAPVVPWLPSRRRLDDSPVAPLKIASGCNRRCAFCAIPAFRGPLVSRPAADIVAEARWLAGQGVKELFLVSENTTSFGRDQGSADALDRLLADLSQVEAIERLRLSYLQPDELSDRLIDTVARLDAVVPYFDLPFQHGASEVLRRMRRRGDASRYLGLLDRVRAAVPAAGIRTNVIVGFPGETEADVAALIDFLGAADCDAVGVFAYSDEEGTPAAALSGHLDEAEITARAGQVRDLVDSLCAARAAERVGLSVDVLIEGREDGRPQGHAGQQGPDDARSALIGGQAEPGQIVRGRITATDGVDWLVAPM